MNLALLGLGALALFFFAKQSSAAPPQLRTAPGAPIMPPSLQDRIAVVMQALGVDAAGNVSGGASPIAIRTATALASELEESGFPQAAAQLRGLANRAAAAIPPPPPQQQVPLPPGIPPAFAAQIQRAIQLEGDPANLKILVTRIKTLPKSAERDAAVGSIESIIAQIEIAKKENATLQKVDNIIKSPSIPQVQAAKQAAPLPVVITARSPGLPQTIPAGAPPPVILPAPVAVPLPIALPAPLPSVILTPAAPIPISPIPIPQALPAAKTPIQILADALAANLRSVQGRLGMPGAKGKENKSLVKEFQRATGGKPDGLAGPGTFVKLMQNGVTNMPLVMYWPRGSGPLKVLAYRKKLIDRSVLIDPANPNGAQELRSSAIREKGQAGIVGVVTD